MKALKRTFKILAYVVSGIVLLTIIIAGFTQTKFFKDRLRVILVSEISTQLNGSLYLGTIRGNFITGFTVDSASIYSGEDHFLSSGKFVVRYDPFTLPNKTLTLKHIIIERPAINIFRKKGGDWNIGKLFKPSNDTSSGKFDWNIILENLELKNASFTFVDSESISSPDHEPLLPGEVEYHNFALNDVSLKMSAQIQRNNYSATIQHLSFYSVKPQFELTHFTGSYILTDKGITAKNMIMQTGHSYLEIDAKLQGANIFEGINLPMLRNDSTKLHFSAKNIDFTELKSFLPPVKFLEGSALVDLDVEGKFGDLTIKRLNVRTYSTSLNLAGKLQNLHDPKNLSMDVFIGDSKIKPSDAATLMPSFQLPSFSKAGVTDFTAHYVGKPLDFKTKATLKGSFGSIDVDGFLNLVPETPRYEISFITDNLNLRDIVGMENMNTHLNSRGTLKGEGFSLDNIRSDLVLSIDSSRFRTMTFGASSFQINARDKKFQGMISLSGKNSKADINGTIDFTQRNNPSYHATGNLSKFDFSAFLNDQDYRTNLNLRATLSGSGNTVDNINGDLLVTILPSTVHEYDWAQEQISLSIDQTDPKNKSISLYSSAVEAEIHGSFDLDIAGAALQQQIENLIHVIAKHVDINDTIDLPNQKITADIHRHTPEQRLLDFDYSVQVKNLQAVSGILGKMPFNARGTIQGHVEGSDQTLSISGKSSFEELFYGTINEGVLLQRGEITFELGNMTMNRTLENLVGKISAEIQSGVSKITPFDSIRATISLLHGENNFSFSGILDSTYKVQLTGKSSAQKGAYAIDLENMSVQVDSSIWINDNDVQLRFTHEGIRIMHAAFQHHQEFVSATGLISDTGRFDVDALLRNISLQGLSAFGKNSSVRQKSIGFDGTISADIHLDGTSRAPILNVTIQGDGIAYRQSRLGNVIGRFQYDNELALIDVNVQPSLSDSISGLTIEGTLPINLAFSGVTDRFPDREQHIIVKAESFNLGILEPILVEFENLSGTLVSDLTLSGTPKKPQYTGSLSINNAGFTFIPNNIAYTVSGNLEPSGEKIRLSNFHIRNVPQDKVDGDATLEGTITLKDFQINNFDLKLNGQLLFMNDASRKIMPTMYGTLFAATSTAGLSLQGNLEQPYLSGDLFIREANLVFPPTKVSTNSASAYSLNYIVIDDTTKYTAIQPAFSQQFYSIADSAESESESERTAKKDVPSLLDRLRYDLNIETQGPTRIRMIFTPATGEELYAELDGKVNALNNTGTPNIYGEISITTRSYYNFFRKFDATGDLKFVGQWDNPELGINATYEGVSVKDTITQKVFIDLAITGTRYEPKLVMGMKVQSEQDNYPVDWASKGGDVQADAISFILTGKFRDDLTTKDREGIVNNVGSTAGTSAVTGITSTFLSGMLTDFLRKEFSFIRSAEVSYRGGNLQESADLRLSGEAFKGYWRFGGKIFNDIGNANVSYQISLGDVFNARSIRNLFIELERRVEGSEFEERKLTNAARLYYRISF